MRVLLLVATALLTAACSSGPEGTGLRRSNTTGGKTSSETTSSDRRGAPTTDDPPASGSDDGAGEPAPAPAPTPTTSSSSPAPAPPPLSGSCANPKCVGLLGTGGCKATDSSGASVVLGCDQGACACLTGGKQTTAFEGDAETVDDLKSLFFANCGCL